MLIDCLITEMVFLVFFFKVTALKRESAMSVLAGVGDVLVAIVGSPGDPYILHRAPSEQPTATMRNLKGVAIPRCQP